MSGTLGKPSTKGCVMSENPTSDDIDETDDQILEKDAERAAGTSSSLDEGGYGGPGPENETGDDDGT